MGQSTKGGVETGTPARKGPLSECGAHVSSPWGVLQFVQGATFSLNVTEVQLDARNHDLGTTAVPR